MPALTPLLTAIVALAAGAWLAVAVWAAMRAARREAAARRVIDDHGRLAALLQAGPAMPLLVAADGTISGPDRLAGALGLAALPPRWLALFGEEAPFPIEEAAELGRVVGEAASGGRCRHHRPAGRVGADLPDRRRARPGRLCRAFGPALVRRRHRRGGGCGAPRRPARAPLGGARRARPA